MPPPEVTIKTAVLKSITDAINSLAGIMTDIMGYIADGYATIEQLETHLDALSSTPFEKSGDQEQSAQQPTPAGIQLISNQYPLLLSTVSGTRRIYNATRMFSYISEQFSQYVSQKEFACLVTAVSVYEMTRSASYYQVFNSFKTVLDNVCLTQHQILNFIVLHRKWLQKSGSTLFLFKGNAGYFVARVVSYEGGLLNAMFNTIGDSMPWTIGNPPRIVIPQLAPSS